MEVKGWGKLVSERENVCVIAALVVQDNPCVSEYHERKANTGPERACARCRARSPQKDLVEMYPAGVDISPPDARVSASCLTYISGLHTNVQEPSVA